MTTSFPGCGQCTDDGAAGGGAEDGPSGAGPADGGPAGGRPAGGRPARPVGEGDACDGHLVHAVADGDKDALSRLFARHAGPLFAHLLNRGFPAQTVEDAVQETFLTVWKSASGFHEGSVTAWLRRIAHCRAVDLERAAGRQRALADRAREHTPASAGTAPSAEDCLLASSPRYAAIAFALAGLPAPQREVIELRYLQHYSVRETAERLAVPEGTVKARAARGCARLREWIVAQDEARRPDGVPRAPGEGGAHDRDRVPRPRP